VYEKEDSMSRKKSNPVDVFIDWVIAADLAHVEIVRQRLDDIIRLRRRVEQTPGAEQAKRGRPQGSRNKPKPNEAAMLVAGGLEAE
jgi:hypothetical protein